LRADVERLAFSAIWELTWDMQVIDIKFTKSIIKSRKAMTYEEAQNLIDDDSKNDEVTESLRILMHAAKILRARRYVLTFGLVESL
jgi:exosome complex exonuclease DIS3/RRP44